MNETNQQVNPAQQPQQPVYQQPQQPVYQQPQYQQPQYQQPQYQQPQYQQPQYQQPQQPVNNTINPYNIIGTTFNEKWTKILEVIFAIIFVINMIWAIGSFFMI